MIFTELFQRLGTHFARGEEYRDPTETFDLTRITRSTQARTRMSQSTLVERSRKTLNSEMTEAPPTTLGVKIIKGDF